MQNQWAFDLIRRKLKVEHYQTFSRTKEELWNTFVDLHSKRLAYVVGNEPKRVVVVFIKVNDIIVSGHIFSDKAYPWDIVQVAKQARKWLFKHTTYNRIELRFVDEALLPLAKRMGFRFIGNTENSWLGEDGKYIAEFLFGFNRSDMRL